jgi:hypothetical protein
MLPNRNVYWKIGMRPPWARRTSLPHTVGFREGRHGATLTSANPAATSADATRARPPEANFKTGIYPQGGRPAEPPRDRAGGIAAGGRD